MAAWECYSVFLCVFSINILYALISGLSMKSDFLRDMDAFPLPANGQAYNCPQPGKCNHFNLRYHHGVPAFIVQHHTVGDYNSTINFFTSCERHGAVFSAGVSSHFVIAKDGTIQLVVAEEFRAFHAGVGRLSKESGLIALASTNLSNFGVVFNHDILNAGRGDMNSWSIGIENVNSGDEPFTKEQIKANIFLCEYLCDRFPTLNPRLMIAHSDWSYNKIDPSPYFPWNEFANAEQLYPGLVTRNFGVYPRKGVSLKKDPEILISGDDEKNNKAPLKTIVVAQDLLRAYGFYIPEEETAIVGNNTKDAIFAAHIHFQGPKILNDPILSHAWHKLAHDVDIETNHLLLTVFDENLLVMLADCVAQLKGL